MKPQTQQVVFSGLILLAAVVSGSAFLLMKNVMHVMPLSYTLALRFTISFVGLLWYVWQARDTFGWRLIKHGAITGTLLYLAFFTQTWGLQLTTTSKNALITGGYVIVVPFLLWFITKAKISARTWICALVCFIGVGIITPNTDFSINLGDVLSIVGCFLYAAHIVSVSICSRTSDLMALTCLQFGFSALWAWAIASNLEVFPTVVPTSAWLSIAWLALAATLGAMTMMNIGIRYVSSTRTALLLSTESLFGSLAGILFANDPFTISIAIGGTLICGSVILSQADSAEGPTRPVKPATSGQAREVQPDSPLPATPATSDQTSYIQPDSPLPATPATSDQTSYIQPDLLRPAKLATSGQAGHA